jgi:signal transduction histidine kinase/DNA-binding response OmpR family regulator
VGRALLELDDGSVLATTRGAGLLHLRQDGEVHARSTDAGLPNEALRYLARAPDGHVWVTAGGGGLCRLGELAGHTLAEVAVDCLGTREGLPDGFVHAVNWDDFGRMWLSTNRGLVLLNPEDVDAVLAGERAQVSPFLLDTSDGMASAEGNGVYQSPVSTGDDGTLAYATQRGVAVLHPDRVDVDPDVPAYLTSVKVDGREHPIEDGLVLEADFQQLELTWSAVDFVRPKKLRFRYRVGDSRWSLPTEARTHVWQTLPPGDQTVQVQAGLAGTWGPPATLRVHRTPRWSEHPAYDWVLVLLAMLGTAGALGARVVHAQRQRAQLEAVVRERTAALSERTAELADRNALLEVQGDLLEKQADELHRRDEERVRFVANISHELRTPLTLVQAPLEEMDATALSPVDATHLDRARRSARRLGELVGQLIDVARLDAGGVALKVRRADLGAFCRRVADRFGSASQQRGQCLDVRVDDLVAWFDPDHMDKIVSNLLGNAMKFTPQAGTIRLTLKQQGEGDDSVAVLTVDDSGPGVPDDEKGRIFERFYQSSSEDTREHEGTGMGLTLAHELVALHGGDVVVEDSPLGGARFVVRVPRGTSHLSPEEILLGEAADEVPTEPTEGHDDWPVLLVVEDHPDMRAFLVQSLSTSFRIRAARNGLEALAMMATERPDVVLSDVMMPELDGVSLCTRMKAAPDLAAIPVLLLSAKTSGADRERGLEVADDYMTKPFRVAELRLRLHRLVGRAREADAPPGTPEAPRTPEAPETPEAPARPAAEVRFMEKLEALVAARMADCDFRAKDLATELGMGPRQLHRRVGDVWGLSPSALLRERRLLAAREMLRRGEFETVAEIAGAVGMAPSYFSRAYRQWAGRPPSADLPR